MHARHPELAAEFERHTPKGKKLPKHVKKHSNRHNKTLRRLRAQKG